MTHSHRQDLSVSAAYLTSVLTAATQAGLSRADLLAAAGLADPSAHEPDQRIPAALFLALLNHISERGLPDIGLRTARLARPGTFGALGYAAMSCRTLGEAAALTPLYEDLVLNLGKTHVAVENEEGVIRWQARHPHAALRPLNDLIVGGWFCFAQWVTGQFHQPRAVYFHHPAPDDTAPYTSLFACPVYFSAAANAIHFDAAYLATPVVQPDDALHHLMCRRAEHLLAQLAVGGGLRQQVVAAIQSALPRQSATQTRVAEALGMSERTLRRRLAEEDASFQQLLTEVRSRLALVYLRDDSLALQDIALLLGYHEQSAFTTAFKHWHGMTPGQWRADAGRNAEAG